jgi:hypothetical protein
MNKLLPEIQRELSSKERLLWSGQPRQGIALKSSDVMAIPFSLMWGGFAIFWESSVIDSNAPFFFMLWGIPFVLVGLYMIIGRFFFDASTRRNTFYGVSNERVLIVSGIFNRQIKSLNLRTLTDLSLTEGREGEGTISFGGGSGMSSMFGGFAAWPGTSKNLGPRF